MANQSIEQINQQYEAVRLAGLRRNSDLRPRLQMRVTWPLDVAATASNPMQFSEAFTGFYVETATDNNANVQMSLNSKDASSIFNYTTLHKGDAADCGQEIKGAYLTWAAQPGKTITFVFYFGVIFRPGQQTSVIQGGVVVSTGVGMTPVASVAVTAVATQILAADLTRKKSTLVNLSGGTFYLSGLSTVVGNVAVGGLTGIPVPPGASYEITHTSAVWGITDAGTTVVAINTEA